MFSDMDMNQVSSSGATKEKQEEHRQDIKKKYKCPINIAYPETKAGERQILARIEAIMKGITQSDVDLDFVKEIVIDENSEEVMFMDFSDFSAQDLRKLPWSRVEFETENLTRGSTVLHFNLTFRERPRNSEEVNLYRIMELIILSAIEHLQFIKYVEPLPVERTGANHIILSARFKAHTENFQEELMQKMLKKLRATVKLIAENEDEASEEVIDKLLEKILKKKGIEEVDWLKTLIPVDRRNIVRQIVKDSKITEKDMAAVTFEIDTKAKKNKSSIQHMPKSTDWLFPFDFRIVMHTINSLSYIILYVCYYQTS